MFVNFSFSLIVNIYFPLKFKFKNQYKIISLNINLNYPKKIKFKKLKKPYVIKQRNNQFSNL